MLSCIVFKVTIFDENYFARFRCLCMTLVDVTTRWEFFLHPVFMKKMSNNNFFQKETLSLYLE